MLSQRFSFKRFFFFNLLIFKFFLITYNHRFTGVTTGPGLAFKMFDLWSITMLSNLNAFHGFKLDILASNTSRSWKLFEAKSFAVFLTIQYELYMFVTNFPFKRSWWATLLSVTESLKEGWKEMFLTAWKGLHNCFHSYWLAPLPITFLIMLP